MALDPSQLKPETLIKRVMSGKKEYRTNYYLTCFSNIPSNQLYSPTYSRSEIIKLWNSLQNTPNKVRYFTFSLVHNYDHSIRFLKKNTSYCKWAYICHDKDKSAEHKHYHFLLMFDSPRSFKSVGNDLEVPVTMLQKVYSKKGILDYLTHENDPNKYHYSLSDVQSNFDLQEEKEVLSAEQLTIEDVKQEFIDYCDMRNGIISPQQFFDKYARYIVRHQFSQRLQVCERVFNAAQSSNSCSGASLSSRAEFGVHTPVPNRRFQAGFPEIFPNNSVWLEKGSRVTFPSDQKAPAQKKSDYRKPNPRSDLA